MSNNYAKIIAEQYLKQFYAFALSRTHNVTEAEDLSQEIAYQALYALSKTKEGDIENLSKYIWSVAHNTYKRWLRSFKRSSILFDNDRFYGQAIEDSDIEQEFIERETKNNLHREISLLANMHRKVVVAHYYENLNSSQIAEKLNISAEMVRFYLMKSKQKIREGIEMTREFGEKCFNPAPFTIHRGTLDFCGVNVWEIFKRKLTCQIALICYDNPARTDEICLETGTPAAYIEDELQLLLESELVINPVKDKYQTNFFILRKNAMKQVKNQLDKLYSQYVPSVIEIYEKYLPEMKTCGIFRYDARDKRYAWFFENQVIKFTGDNFNIPEHEYMILADGVKGFIYAQEATESTSTKGHAVIYSEKDNIKIHASAPDKYRYLRCERELIFDGMDLNGKNNLKKISALYDIYKDDIKESEIELYAQLIEQGYAFKGNGKVVCDVAVHTEKSRQLFSKINNELEVILAPLCKEIYENISRIIASTIPPHLKQYIHGYTVTEIQFYASIYFREALYDKCFLTMLEDDDRTPVSCWIDEL